MKKRIIHISLLCVLMLLLASCKKDAQDTGTETATTDTAQSEAGAETTVPEATEAETEDPEVVRARMEEERKEQYGEFYVPLPAEDAIPHEPVKAKGVFITTTVAAYDFDESNIDAYADSITNGTADPDVNQLEMILGLAKATEMNTIVVDVKTDDGFVTLNSEIDIVNRVDSTMPGRSDNYKPLLDYCEANDIHVIARVVTFKDPYFAENNPDHSIQLTEGGVYRDGAGTSWVNPFDDYVWNYVVAISKEAALAGFDEIQFDYVRFPDGAASYNPITTFPGRNDRDKDEAIAEFLAFAREELEPYGVPISADVFGIITHTWDDSPEDIGQTWRLITDKVDAISPMIYPSHYSYMWYGYEYPDQHPYGVLYQSMQEAIERNSAVENPAALRPWIQGFTAPWVDGYIDYDAATIAEQIVACRDLGIEEYLIWATGNSYDPEIFNYEERVGQNERGDDWDLLDQTPEEALDRFLGAQYNEYFATQYLMTKRDDRVADFDEFAAEKEAAAVSLDDYTIGTGAPTANGWAFLVNATYSSAEGVADVVDGTYLVELEDGVYKIRMPELVFEQPVEETEAEDGEDVTDEADDSEENVEDVEDTEATEETEE